MPYQPGSGAATPQNIIRLSGIALMGMMLVGFALRVYRLEAQSLWYDEAVSWHLTQMALPQLTVWTANDIQPPLYYYLLWFWVRLTGTSEYALRFPSVLCATLTLPLLWRLAHRLLGTSGAWVALSLALLSPFHVYYAQEARMYTLLTLLGVMGTYLWLRLLGASQRVASASEPFNLWIATAYAVTMAAALYTHYFTVFLLAAHWVVWGWSVVRHALPLYALPGGRARGTNRSLLMHLRPVLISLLVITLLYAPWWPFLLGRYVQDTSYWPGTLNVAEMARRLFLTFTLGETVKETVGVPLAFGFGVILVVSLAIWIWTARGVGGFYRRVAVACVLSWLVVPVVLILLLAWHVPKFNPRYAILAWPALVLLFAGGLAALLNWKSSRDVRRGMLRHAWGVLGLGFILATSVYSLRNWYLPYRDNQFNKADFRITAQVVRERITPDETVLLSSGHMAPAWAYYYGWEGWHPIPAIETLDVRAVLDLSVGAELTRILSHKSGVWLVRWQNDVTDPFDVLPLLLSIIGVRDDYGQFWHMELHHYHLPPMHVNLDLERIITHPVHALLGGQMRLVGLRPILSSCPSTGGVPVTHAPVQQCLTLVIAWQAVAPVQEDYAVFVHLQDEVGSILANADHLPARPTSQWPVGRIFPDQVLFKLPTGMPDGNYWLELGLYVPSRPGLPRLGPVVLEPSGELQAGERVLVPLRLKGDVVR
ncbi:MAG: glycosyltransferase family 39 protein [Anaerolineae bacterium]|nr:glycosyltransferase family 39 protein [Anaerolineae bacterium]